MDIRHLSQLIMIENSQSMRGAADKLFISQSTLSHNLKKIETELGCELFDRSRNQLSLNSYGKIVLNHAKKIIEEMETAKREIAEEKLRSAKKISIGVYAYAFQSFVMPNLANAIDETIFECYIRDSDRLKEELLSGSLDVIFTDHFEDSSELIAQRLFKEQLLVSLPSSSEYASRQSIFISDLPNLDIFLVTNASGYTPWFEQVLKTAGVDISSLNKAEFKEYLYVKDTINQCHLTGTFIMRFLPTAVRRILVPLAEESGFRDIYMVYKKRDKKRLSPLIAYIEAHQNRLFTGSAFLPYFLFPSESSNLLFCDPSDQP